MRRLVLFGRFIPDLAGPPARLGNGVDPSSKGVSTGRARTFFARGCVWGEGWTRFGDALASKGWLR